MQRDEALQELVGKVKCFSSFDIRCRGTHAVLLFVQVDMLHDAFNSLSDVFTCEIGKPLPSSLR
jgi:hypothetical protein